MSDQTIIAAHEEAEKAPRMTWRELSTYFGPAFIASIAYIDPGNFGANIEGGSRFGYRLLWVLLWSNLMAMLVQFLSAKLGIVTGKTLPQNCRDIFPRWLNLLSWAAAEIAAIATDLAEFLGAALGFYLLIGPLMATHGVSKTHMMLAAALLTTIFVFLILAMELRGYRSLEWTIIGFVCIIGLCYAAEIFLVHPNWGAVAQGVIVPHLNRAEIYIAVSMLGATVMPHVVYLHSSLVQPRLRFFERKRRTVTQTEDFRRRYLRFELIDVLVAMNGAWLINSAMVIMAAGAFAGLTAKGMEPVTSIEQAHHTLGPLLGPASAVMFAVALLCSGLSSSTVGVMAGQVIIEGFLKIKFPIYLRRLITIIPALIVIAIGLDPLKILILSQVVLSFALPFALVPLIWLTSRKALMGEFVNGSFARIAGWATVSLILVLNVLLLWQTFTA